MKSLLGFTLVAFALLVSACGGGGGGTTENQTSPATPTAQPTPAPTTPTAERIPPTTTITFPWRSSISHADNFMIRGTASDASGIAEVGINDLSAVLGNTIELDGLQTTEWSASINLPSSLEEYTVQAVDAKGNASDNTPTVSLQKSVEVPYGFILDEANTRIIGVAVDSGIIEYNYETLALIKHENFFSIGGVDAMCLRPNTNNLFYISAASGEYYFGAYNLETKTISVSGSIPYSDETYDFTQQPIFNALECDENSLYLLMEVPLLGGGSRSRIVKADLTMPPVISVILETGDENATSWQADTMHLANGKLVTAKRYEETPIQIIDLNNLQVSNIGSVVTPVSELLLDSTGNTIYILNNDVLRSLNTSSAELEVVSASDEEEYIKFHYVQSANLAENAILAYSPDIGAIISIDLATGERSVFMSETIGEGPQMYWNKKFAVSENEQYAFVLDQGTSRVAHVWRVDLRTGNRSLVSRAPAGYPTYAQDILYDDETDTVYWGIQNEIKSFNLETLTNGTVTSALVGSGVLFGSYYSLEIDKANNRLLVFDYSEGMLLEVDIATGARAVLSADGIRGSGPALSENIAAGISLAASGDYVYVTDDHTTSVYTINLETGDRSLMMAECENADGVDLFYGQLLDVVTDVANNLLWINGGALLAYDFGTGLCRQLDDGPGFSQVKPTSSGHLLGIGSHELYVIDKTSGAAAILSK